MNSKVGLTYSADPNLASKPVKARTTGVFIAIMLLGRLRVCAVVIYASVSTTDKSAVDGNVSDVPGASQTYDLFTRGQPLQLIPSSAERMSSTDAQ